MPRKVGRTPQRPLFADEATYSLIVKFCAQASTLLGEKVSPSAIVRYAIQGPCAEWFDAVPDMGSADVAALRDALKSALTPQRPAGKK